jgi:sigma-B regulation protein RsbU (phosphoserine phosphatase)
LQQNSLVEKLSLQAESFQEGFELLAKSNSFEELTKNFWHILRGNFITTQINVLHKAANSSNWNKIQVDLKFDEEDISLLNIEDFVPIKYLIDKKYNAIVVLPLADSSILGIMLGRKLDNSELNDFDKITLQILLQVFSSAHKIFLNQKNEKKLIFELNEKVLQLNNLIDAGIELSKYENQNILFELALERIVILTNASLSGIVISNKENTSDEKHICYPVSVSIENILSKQNKIEASFEFNNQLYRIIISEKEARKGTTSFDDLDEILLQAVSRQIHASLENNYLLKQSLEKERIEKELNLAAAIQQKIIPKELPMIPGYELAGINIPSREVGGDYYDCVRIDNDKYALIMADVAGKGISAALLVSTLNAALYSYLEFNLPLNEFANKLNKLIYKSSPPDKYITFFIAVLDSKTGELDILNAGHNPALLLRKNGTLEQIEAGGIGLGMLDLGIPYTGQKLIMNSSDQLFLYTDGIPEAMNTSDEEYTDQRMIQFFTENSYRPVEDFIKLIVEDVKKHVGTAEQSDDITALIIECV